MNRTITRGNDTIRIGIDESQYFTEIRIFRANGIPIRHFKNLESTDMISAESEALRRYDDIKTRRKDHYAQ